MQVTVIGTGVIGTGWVLRFLAEGHGVSAWDPAPGFGDQLVQNVTRLWTIMEKRGLAGGASAARLRIAGSLGDACMSADLVQESAPENLALKQALHIEIDQHAPAAALVATSSSGLLPTEVFADCHHAARCLVAHPFNPVYILPLCELVGGDKTSEETVKRAREVYASVGMKPLVVRREIEGYLSDRLQEALWREVLHLVNDDIATTGELDDAITYGPGLRWALMGTCLTFHMAGGEGGMRHMLEQFGPALKLPWTHLEAPELTGELIEKMVAGTTAQAADRTMPELEVTRDEFLLELLALVEKYRARLS